MGRPGRPRKNSPRAGGPASRPPAPKPQPEQPKPPANPSQWVEPPLANLRPSYQENDPNSERNVSTAHMQPLGKLPNKIATKTGTGRRPGRPPLNKGKQTSSAASSRTQTPKPTPAPVPLPRTGTFFTSINSEDEGDNSTKTAQGRQRLAMVVEAAVTRSTEVGNVELGRAIRKLHDESMNNPDLAHLLDAVLAQRATPEQTAAFQLYIRNAREALAKQEADLANGVVGGLAAHVGGPLDAPAPKKRGRKKKILSEPRAVSEDSMLSGGQSNGIKLLRPVDDGDETVSEGESVEKRLKTIPRPSLPAEADLIKFSSIRDSPRPTPGPNELMAKRRGRKRARSTSPGRELEYSSEPYLPDDGSEFGVNGPPQKKRNTRVKTTSETHVMAGVSQSIQAVDPRDNNDPSENISENDDFCSACGGMGTVICCDRCPLSFHYTCVDPPLEDAENIESWYCNKCENMFRPKPRHPRGLFSDLLDIVERKNPTAFSLPAKLKNYFEGVQAGKHGEYVDTTDAKSGKSKNQETEYYKLQTKEGVPILCHKCGDSSLGKRIVLKCDFCPLNWHLDCLDPPPANPPAPSRKWECPAHIDRHFTIRRPRNAKVVDTYLRRGHKNNGIIEIANESDGEDDGFRDEYRAGYVYRLPEKGIKLDFISAVKRKRDEDHETEKRIKLSESTRVSSRASSVPHSAIGGEHEPVWTRQDIEAADAIAHLKADYVGSEGGFTKVLVKLVNEATPELKQKIDDQDTVIADTEEFEAQQMRLIIALAQQKLKNLEEGKKKPADDNTTKPTQEDVEMLQKDVKIDVTSPNASTSTRIIPEIVASPGPANGN